MIKILEHTPEIEELVINWHLTEVCNFRCQSGACQSQGRDKSQMPNLALEPAPNTYHPSLYDTI